MSGPLRKKRDYKRDKVPLEWQVDCGDDDIYGELPPDEEVKQHASVLKSHQHHLKKRVKQGKKVLEIISSYWSFHNGDSGFAYHLAGVDEEGRAAVVNLSNNSFKTVEEARVAASLLGYEAYQSGTMHMMIE